MKSSYYFDTLKKELVSSVSDSQAIFSKILSVANPKNLSYTERSMEGFSRMLSDEVFYVAQSLYTRRGKEFFFRGSGIYVAGRKDINEFVMNSLLKDDLRSLFLAPIFADEPSYVIFAHEDALFFKYINVNI